MKTMKHLLACLSSIIILLAVSAYSQTHFLTDFSLGVPAGSAVFGSAQVTNGTLRLNDGANALYGTYVINDFNNSQPVSQFVLQALVRIGESACCTAGRNELRPADGMSFVFSPNTPYDSTWNAGWIEEGLTTGLTLSFDTWDNATDVWGADTAPAITLYYNGVAKAVAPLDGWRDDNTPDAGYIPIDPQNGAPLTLYTDARDQTFVKVTSGANAGKIFQCHQGDSSVDLATLTDGTLAGPTIYVGLAGDTNFPPAPGPGYIALAQRGTFTFAVKAANVIAQGYVGMVLFNDAARGEDYIVMGVGSTTIPAVMIGHSRGLAIAGVASAAALVVGNAGANVAMVRTTPPVAPYAPLGWVLRPDGSSDVWWKGVKIIDNVQTGYQPVSGGRFGMGGRTGGANEAHVVDNLSINLFGTGTGPARIVTQPASLTVTQNQAVKFEVVADGAPFVYYQWQINGVDLPGENGPVISRPMALYPDYDGLRLTVVVSNALGTVTSQEAVLTVLPDIYPPTLRSASGNATWDKITVVFSEALDPGTAVDTANYTVTDPLGNALTISGVVLNPDGVSVTLSLDPTTLLVNTTLYTVTVYYVSDLAGNAIADASAITFSSYIFTPGLIRFDYFNNLSTTDNSLDTTLLADPRYPNNPTATYYISSYNSRQVFPDDTHEGYGARMTGIFVPPTSGNYVFYLLSDDLSRLFLNPNGIDAAGKVLIAEDTVCCGPWSRVFSAPQPLTAGAQYYLEAIYKEGTGGDYLFVGATLEGAAAPSDTTRDSIQGSQVGGFYDPNSSSLNITQQPQDQLFIINPLGVLVSQEFNSSDGGFTVETPVAFDGPWAYNAARGSWQMNGQGPDNGHANTSKLNSPSFTVTLSGHVSLTFVHRWSFEYSGGSAWDGGQVRVSINGGPYTMVPASAFGQNGYNGVVQASSYTGASDLIGQPAFINESPSYASGYVTSRADLGALNAGDTVSVEFFAAADSNTSGQVPNWEIDSVTLNQGAASSLSTFTVAAAGSYSGQPMTVRYQWQKNTGSGFVDIPGATGTSYSLTPILSDNGTRLRAHVIIPGSSQYSGEATLTVAQLNTPPSFTAGPNQAAECSGPAKTVPDWATNIKPHSIPQNTYTYGSDFASGPIHPGPSPWQTDFSAGLPAGTISAGTVPPYVGSDGSLHLTDQVNGNWNYWTIPSLGPQTVPAVQASWKTKLTGVGGADGFSFNMGTDLGTGYAPPEGAGNGLSVTVDTYDNGGGEVGCEVRWNGTRLAFVPAGSGAVHGPVELMKDVFVNASVTVDASGLATFTYDNFVVSAQIPDYTGITFNQYSFAAATGGANENCWIDDLSISAPPLVADAPPAGSQVAGNAYVADGILHVTDAVNGAYGSFTTPPFTASIDSYNISFKLAVGGGTCCGDPTTGNVNSTADGLSVNIAANLPAPGTAEEGEGNGVSVCFDTWDNGGGEAPAIDLKYRGNLVATYKIQVAQAPAPAVPNFIPVTISVSPAGLANVTYDGNAIFDNVQLPDYRAETGLRVGMAARTGGANEDHWIDDLAITAFPLDASSVEASQIVQFAVSNDNPGLFTAQPAIAPDGTLTYTPAAGMVGVAHVTVVAHDNGGTAYGGNDTSAPQTFTITVADTTPPVLHGCPANLTVECGEPLSFTVTASDTCAGALPVVCTPPAGTIMHAGPPVVVTCTAFDPATNGASCSFVVTVVDTRPPVVSCPASITVPAASDAGTVVTYVAGASDPCGLASFACTPPSGSTFPMGTTAVTCTAVDVAGLTASCTFAVAVTSANEPPVCDTKFPCSWTEGGTFYAIALDGAQACLVLDGSGSTDPDVGDTLTFTWIVDGTNSTSGAVVTNCLATGCHPVVLVVSDGLAESRCARTLCVITAGEAIDQTIALVEGSTLARKNKRPLIASLKAAQASFDRESMESGLNQLHAFQNKVRAQIAKENPAEAAAFIASVQKITDAVNCASQ